MQFILIAQIASRILFLWILTLWTNRTLEYFILTFFDVPADGTLVASFLLSLFLHPIMFAINLIVEILRISSII